MIIRKLFKFENAHIVRNCLTDRCKKSIHGHSYKVELLLKANALDNGQMVMDFSQVKTLVKDLIDSFDHAITLWDQDDAEYIKQMQTYSARWVLLPVSPSAEQYSRVIFKMVKMVLDNATFTNNESGVEVYSVIVHETDTGYAQAFLEDIENPKMGLIDPKRVIFSQQVMDEWSDSKLWEKLIRSN